MDSTNIPTTIGNKVFIGSDSALVAPVKIGNGAYVGCGFGHHGKRSS